MSAKAVKPVEEKWAEVELSVTGKDGKAISKTSKRLVKLVEELDGNVQKTSLRIAGHVETLIDICRLPAAKVENLMRRAPTAADIKGDDVTYEIKRLSPSGKHL